MEILSIGEKIKRSRIYKGYTLKDICNDKVSVSKMSCIENNKIKPEKWLIEFIAKKLDISEDYLNQDVREQLLSNIQVLEKNPEDPNYEANLDFNLSCAEEYKYYDIAFTLMHLMFKLYLDTKKLENLQLSTSKYYDIYQKLGKDDNLCTYYMDIARFLFISKEYDEAANYYSNVRKVAREKSDNFLLARATYNETACNFMLEKYERAYEIGVRLVELVDYLDTEEKKGDAYHILALLSIRRDKDKFDFYESKSNKIFNNNVAKRATAEYNYAVVMFNEGMKERGVECIKRALSTYPKSNKEELARFMLMNIEALIENNFLETAQSICNEALDLAIILGNNKFIEKAYYFKAVILEKNGNINLADVYMNLSLDALLKIGSKIDIHERYIDMGNMYHKMNEISDSLKYFNLAMNLEKRM